MSIGDTDFGVQVGIGFVGRVVTAFVAFLGSIFLARVLGPEGYGTFYLFMAITEFLDNPVTGWANACRKRLTEDRANSGEVIGSTILGILVASVLVFFGVWVASPLITEKTGNQDAWILLGCLFVGMVSFITSLEVMKATEHFGSSTWIQAVRDVIRVLAQASLVILGFGVGGMVAGMVFANLVVAPVVIYLVGSPPRIPSRDTLKQVWVFAKSSIPNGVLGTAQNRMDVILLGMLVSPGIVGNYEVAMRMTMPAMFVAGIAGGGLMGRVSNRHSQGRNIIHDVQNNLSYVSVLSIPLFFGALSIGEQVIVTAYGGEFARAGTFLAGLSLFRLIRSQKSILVSTLDGVDRPDLNLRASSSVFTLNIVLGLVLLYAIGAFGVVIATIISEAVAYGIRVRFVKSIAPSLTIFPRPLLEQFISGGIMAGIIYVLRAIIPLNSWISVLFLVGIGGLVYFASLISISEPFRSTISAIAEDSELFDIVQSSQ